MDTGRIVIFHRKHDDIQFDASTQEKLTEACVAMLRDNYKNHYYYEPDAVKVEKGDRELLKMTEEQLEALPEAVRIDLQKKITKLNTRIERATRQYNADLEWYKAMKEIIDLPFDEAVAKTTTRRGREVKLAISLIQDREDAEYEGYEIAYLTDPRTMTRLSPLGVRKS